MCVCVCVCVYIYNVLVFMYVCVFVGLCGGVNQLFFHSFSANIFITCVCPLRLHSTISPKAHVLSSLTNFYLSDFNFYASNHTP